MKHYFVSGVVRTKGGFTRGFDVLEEENNEQKTFVTVWGNTIEINSYKEARRDAQRIAEGLNLLEEKENATL